MMLINLLNGHLNFDYSIDCGNLRACIYIRVGKLIHKLWVLHGHGGGNLYARKVGNWRTL